MAGQFRRRFTVKSMRHIISVTLQNEVGALTRVAGLLSLIHI